MKRTLSRTLLISCRFPARAETAPRIIRELVSTHAADVAQPWCMRCESCGQEWSVHDNPQADWRTTTCSQCYAEDVHVIRLRLEYLNWEPKGTADITDRYNFGCAKAKEAKRT